MSGNEITLRLRSLIVVLALLFGVACETRYNKLERGVSFAKHQFSAINTSLLAAMSYQSTADFGGNMTSYVLANAPKDADLPPIFEGPPKPWSVTLSSEEQGAKIIIDGYGDDISKPLIHEQVIIDLEKWHNEMNFYAPPQVPNDQKQYSVALITTMSGALYPR